MTEYSGRVDGLSHDGRGVVRVDGKVFFVEGALPGELISFTRQRRRRKHEIGRLDAIIEASRDRADPLCEYFGVCGGCALQHLSSESQVAHKQRTLIENLERIGKVSPESVMEPITGPVTGYRRKARLGIRYVPKKGGVLVGFRERHKSYITSLSHCPALDNEISKLLPSLHELVSALSCYERLPQIEAARGDRTTALVFRHLTPLTEADKTLLADYSRDHDVDLYLQPGGLDTVAPLLPDATRALDYDLPEFGLTITFSPTDFVQVNGAVNRLMVARAVELLDIEAQDDVLDLFCGIGNFSLPLATRARRVLSVEASEEMVRRGRSNADENGLANAEFMALDLYSGAANRLVGHAPSSKVLLDPPRSGAIEIVRDVIPGLRPSRIVYVSCNPATLARDSEVLVRREGYRLKSTVVVDMFPHTAHVESISLFER